MALRTFVKVSGVNNLSDARYCAGMEVNEIGFNIEPKAANYTAPENFKEMVEWLSGLKFVGEITLEETNIESCIAPFKLDGIQVQHLSQIEEALQAHANVSYYASDSKEALDAWEASGKKLQYILVDGTQLSEEQLILLADELPMVLENVSLQRVDALLESNRIKGIALSGGNEIRPGYKDFDELADMLEHLEIDDLNE